MFSVREKQLIAKAVEDVITSLDHPEMPKEKPKFHLRVDGMKSWSFAEIDPNWTYEDKYKSVNSWNEKQDEKPQLNKKDIQ